MKLSTKTQYGLRFLCYLAIYRDRGPIQLREIAQTEQISNKYLEQIVAQLRPLNVLNITRGAKGGYGLKADPKCVTLYNIFYCLEGGIEFDSTRSVSCNTQKVWQELQKTIDEHLKRVTLQQIIDDYQNINNMYYI